MSWRSAGLPVAVRFQRRRAGNLMSQSVGEVSIALAPLFAGAALIAIVANVLQVGFNFTPQRLAINFAALSPVRGFNKMFSYGQGGLQLLMNLLKVVLVGSVAWSAVGGRLEQIISVQRLSFLQIFALGADVVFNICLRVGVLLLVLAILDYVYQRFRVEKSLKMTKQEVKDEMRSMEGDPIMKQRCKQVAVQRHMQRLKNDVPKADVVVTNPTHYAVALKYEESKMRAPKLVAKGMDFMAHHPRIGRRGRRSDHRAPAPGAGDYRMVDVGEEIPEEFYAAVAELLAYVYELTWKDEAPVSFPPRMNKSAAACCTNTVVSQHHHPGKGQRPLRPALVCAADHRARLVAQRSRSPDRRSGLRAARQGRPQLPRSLPPPQSDLAEQVLKDPYIFDFLTLAEPFRERELELALLDQVQKFLLELGQGFAFVGRQYHLGVGVDDFYLDLLFYHLRLRCFVVVDLKRGPFKPEYAGKMNFYCSVVDDRLRHADDKPTVGLILCQDKNRIVAEYALKGVQKAIGVSEYRLTRALPKAFRSSLPTVEQMESGLIRLTARSHRRNEPRTIQPTRIIKKPSLKSVPSVVKTRAAR